MNERSIFLTALEKADVTERSAYLDSACGHDLDLRRRVEFLLQSHTEAGSFLAVPALQQGNGGSAQAADSGVVGELGETQVMPGGGDSESPLDFLSPSQKPGSLGRLGHYEVLELVGRGGFGQVLRAFDEKLHRVVAVKVMAKEIATNALARKRFLREAQAAAAVTHENVVAIHEIQESGPVPYLVMQFVDGKSLQQRIKEEGSLELKEILRLGLQIASGLAAAHKQGLVHRDIKPANILLENGIQRVKITDFGLARAVDDSSISHSGIVAGTPQYMSPEQADGQPVDHRSDLFSLGSVLYAMCTGRSPFRGSTTLAVLRRVCEETPRPIQELNPDIPQWLCGLIAKLHAKKPAERYQTAKEVAGLLEERLADVQKGVPASLVTIEVAGPAASAVGLASSASGATPTASTSPASMLPARAAFLLLTLAFVSVCVGLVFAAATELFRNGGLWLAGALCAAAVLVQLVQWSSAGWRAKNGIRPSPLAYWLLFPGIVGGVFSAILEVNGTPQAGWYGLLGVILGVLAVLYVLALSIVSHAERAARPAELPTPSFEKARWPRRLAWTVVALLAFLAIAIWGNLIPKTKQLFYHELDVQVPDTAMVVEFWETKDEEKRENARNFSGAWPLEPRATITNRKEKTIKLPPGNYWMFVTKNGKRVEERLLKIGWGGKQTLAIRALGEAPRTIALNGPGPDAPRYTNSLGMQFALVPKGRAWLGGSPVTVGEREVELPEDFYLGVHEVTQEQWQRVMGTNPSAFSRTGLHKETVKDISDEDLKRFPVESVSPDQCQEFIKRLNETLKERGWEYRLPTRQMWQYGCRGGPGMPREHYGFDFYLDQPTNILAQEHANFNVFLKRPCKVGSYPANRLGIHDMHGNVGEWCEDVITEGGQSFRVQQGGGWGHPAGYCRAVFEIKGLASRGFDDAGFRVARVPVGEPWVQLFNGKDLTGWEGDRAIWKWQDGVLTGTSPPGPDLKNIFLWSNRKYRDFEMKFKVKLDNGNSGVQFRSHTDIVEQLLVVSGPQANIVGNLWGSLFDEGRKNDWIAEPSVDSQKAVKPGEFNDYYVRCVGKQVTIRINGVTMLDSTYDVVPDEGIIGFQIRKEESAKEAKVSFRDVMMRDLSSRSGQLASADEQGFVPLFNGKDLTGWKPHQDEPGDWRVENGLLVGKPGRIGYLLSERGDYENFHLRAEVKLNAGGDSGLFVRTMVGPFIEGKKPEYVGKKSPPGYEAQICNDASGLRTGSLFLVQEGKEPALIREERQLVQPDQWCTVEIIADGPWLTVKVNGERTAGAVKNEVYARGHLALQMWNDTTQVQFRKIEIKELPAALAKLPDTAEQVLPALAGAWKGEFTQRIYGGKPDVKKFDAISVNDWIIGNKWLRQRVHMKDGGYLSLTAFDPNAQSFRDWFFHASGLIFGPSAGRWDPATRSIIWTSLPQNGMLMLNNWRFVDADTVHWEAMLRDKDGQTIFQMDARLHRTAENLTIDETTAAGPLPPEMAVLERVVGDWQITNIAKDAAHPDGREDTWQMRNRKILGGRVIAMESPIPSIKESYQLNTYDSFGKAYGRWLFKSDGSALEYGGLWDEKTQTMMWHWAAKDGSQSSNKWRFVDADHHAIEVVTKDALGKTTFEVKGTATRQIEPGWVQLFNGKDLTGWETGNLGDKSRWNVRDGAIVGSNRAGLLHTRRSDFANFHLRAEMKVEAGRTAALWFRLPDVPVTSMEGGYKSWVGNDPKWPMTGSLSVTDPKSSRWLHDIRTPLVAPDTWFTLEIIADGPTLRIKVDDKETAAVQNSSYGKGHFALQSTSDQDAQFHVRKIEIKELPATVADKDRLQGAWSGVAGEIGGQPWPETQPVRNYKITFEDDKFRLSFPGGGNATIEGTYQLIPQTNPKQISFFYKLPNVRHFGPGIYRFEGEQLRLHMGGDRPAEFATKRGEEDAGYIILLERDKTALGWTQLFNGKDLTGWKMLPEQAGEWIVENGNLIGRGRPSSLFTERGDYRNFHIRLEAKFSLGADSGLFFRAPFKPLQSLLPYEAQMLGKRDLSFNTGSLWGFPGGEVTQLLVKPDEWFTQEIIARDNHIIIRVNGQTTVDLTEPQRRFVRGHLGLQHLEPSGTVQFRKIEIQELPPLEPGWTQLFNGRDLAGWEFKNWKVADGLLVNDGKGYLRDHGPHENFHCRIEAKSTAKGCASVSFRTSPKVMPDCVLSSVPGVHAAVGTVRQTMTSDPKNANLSWPPKELTTPGKWFTMEIEVKDSRITVKIDGKPAADATLQGMGATGSLDIGTFDDGSFLTIRKIEIKELPGVRRDEEGMK
jgi:uncharacterized protein (TIGR03067 family)